MLEGLGRYNNKFVSRTMKKKMIIKNQNGATVVEFAIVLPLLLVFIFGIIEFSLLLYNKAMITNTSREGARAGIVFAPNRPSEADIQTVMLKYGATSLINFDPSQLHTTTAQHTDSDGTMMDLDDAIAADPPIIDSGETLTVTVNYEYHFLIFPNLMELIKGSFTNSIQLQEKTDMRFE
jgi:Flp pilus assembly protein TadG